MLVTETTIQTDRPQRYLKQLAQHAAAMAGNDGRHRAAHDEPQTRSARPQLHVETTDERVLLRFAGWGHCAVSSHVGELRIRVEATNEVALRRIQQLLSSDLRRFGHRDQLELEWQDVMTY